jgi:hypothetical protein
MVCRFSCGAASAVATKLTLAEHSAEEVVIINAFIQEEHTDNRRFLADCEKWHGHISGECEFPHRLALQFGRAWGHPVIDNESLASPYLIGRGIV